MEPTAVSAPVNEITKSLERPPPLTPELRSLTQELRDLYDEVADVLDRDEVERLPGYFTEDCLYQVISRENHDQGLPQATIFCDGVRMLRDRVLALRQTQVYEPRYWRHFVTGARITAIDGDEIRAQANFLVTEAMSDQEPTVLLVGQYHDRLVRRDGVLHFRERSAVYDNYRVVRSLIVPV